MVRLSTAAVQAKDEKKNQSLVMGYSMIKYALSRGFASQQENITPQRCADVAQEIEYLYEKKPKMMQKTIGKR